MVHFIQPFTGSPTLDERWDLKYNLCAKPAMVPEVTEGWEHNIFTIFQSCTVSEDITFVRVVLVPLALYSWTSCLKYLLAFFFFLFVKEKKNKIKARGWTWYDQIYQDNAPGRQIGQDAELVLVTFACLNHFSHWWMQYRAKLLFHQSLHCSVSTWTVQSLW